MTVIHLIRRIQQRGQFGTGICMIASRHPWATNGYAFCSRWPYGHRPPIPRHHKISRSAIASKTETDGPYTSRVYYMYIKIYMHGKVYLSNIAIFTNDENNHQKNIKLLSSYATKLKKKERKNVYDSHLCAECITRCGLLSKGALNSQKNRIYR